MKSPVYRSCVSRFLLDAGISHSPLIGRIDNPPIFRELIASRVRQSQPRQILQDVEMTDASSSSTAAETSKAVIDKNVAPTDTVEQAHDNVPLGPTQNALVGIGYQPKDQVQILLLPQAVESARLLVIRSQSFLPQNLLLEISPVPRTKLICLRSSSSLLNF